MALNQVPDLNLLTDLAKPCIGFKPVRPSKLKQKAAISDKNLLSELCHIGGTPLLPKDTPWPCGIVDVCEQDDLQQGQTIPLKFICQLNLSELSPYIENVDLPKEGIMQFYVNPFANYGDGFRVLYFKDSSLLEKVTEPESYLKIYGTELIPKARLALDKMFTLPSFTEILEQGVDSFVKPDGSLLTEDEYDELEDNYDDYFDEVENSIGSDLENTIKLMGYGYYIQSAPEDPKIKVLFEMHSFKTADGLEFNLQDSGAYYFMIHEDDLKTQDFSKVVGEIQSY